MWPMAKKKVKGTASAFKEFTQNPHLSKSSWVTSTSVLPGCWPSALAGACQTSLSWATAEPPLAILFCTLSKSALMRAQGWICSVAPGGPAAWPLASTLREYGDRGHSHQWGLSLGWHIGLHLPEALSSLFSKKFFQFFLPPDPGTN